MTVRKFIDLFYVNCEPWSEYIVFETFAPHLKKDWT